MLAVGLVFIVFGLVVKIGSRLQLSMWSWYGHHNLQNPKATEIMSAKPSALLLMLMTSIFTVFTFRWVIPVSKI